LDVLRQPSAKLIGDLMKATLTAASAATAVLCLLSAAHAGEASLTAASIQRLFPGYYEAEVQGGYTLLISAKTAGRLHGKAFGREDEGKWTIVGNELCVSWKSWTNGETKCGEIARAGDWYIARNQQDGQLLRFTAIGADTFSQQVATTSDVERN
jgi:hypothetical protein